MAALGAGGNVCRPSRCRRRSGPPGRRCPCRRKPAAPFICSWNTQVARGPVMAEASGGGDPDAGIPDDVAHLEHRGAKALIHAGRPAVLLKAHHGKAHHLGAASRHGSSAGQTGQTQGRTNRRRGDGQGQRNAHDHRDENAHEEGLQIGGPHDNPAHEAGRRADGRRNRPRKAATPTRMVTNGVTRMSILVSLETALPISAARMAMNSTASGPPAPPRALEAEAYGSQGEQHQRRDSAGHSRWQQPWPGRSWPRHRPPTV